MTTLVRYFARHYPRQSLIVLGCLLLAAMMEGVGLSTLLPLLAIATGQAGDATDSGLEQQVRAALAHVGLTPTVGTLLTVIVAALWLKAALVLLSKRQVGYTVARVATDLRLSLLQALLATRWRYYTRQPVGVAANAMATEADRASLTYEYLALIVTFAIEAMVYVAIALAISWRATLAAALAAAFSVAILSALVRASGRAGRRQTELLRSLLRRLVDALQAVKLLKATGREDAIGPLLAEDSRKLERQLRKRVLSKEALRALQEPLLVTLIAGGVFVAMVGLAMPLSAVLVLVLTFTRALLKVGSIQNKYQSMVTEASALWSIVSMIESAEEETERTGGSAPPRLARAVTLANVRVRYDGRNVLDGASLECPAGQVTAILGPSGAGKTSIVDLVTGLIEPDHGEVRLDDIPLTEVELRAWRRSVGYVPQEVLMLHDSVRVNVTLGDPTIDDARVESALRDAGAWEFVSALPDGLAASVGERGALLSGGQRQRIAIARALVQQPQLLILDEATGALDAESAAAVWRTVDALRGRTTVIAISHQTGLEDIADRVYRIEGGRVREESAVRATPVAARAT